MSRALLDQLDELDGLDRADGVGAAGAGTLSLRSADCATVVSPVCQRYIGLHPGQRQERLSGRGAAGGRSPPKSDPGGWS